MSSATPILDVLENRFVQASMRVVFPAPVDPLTAMVRSLSTAALMKSSISVLMDPVLAMSSRVVREATRLVMQIWAVRQAGGRTMVHRPATFFPWMRALR